MCAYMRVHVCVHVCVSVYIGTYVRVWACVCRYVLCAVSKVKSQLVHPVMWKTGMQRNPFGAVRMVCSYVANTLTETIV